MKRAALALGILALTLYVACTLIERPDSYFDPQGTLVTLAVVPGGAQAIALTHDDVYFVGQSGSTIFRVPKAGGDLQTVFSSTGGDVIALASDGESHVIWCTSSGGLGGFVAELDASTDSDASTGCDLVAVSHDRYAFTTTIEGADGGLQRVVMAKRDDGTSLPFGIGPNVRAMAFDDQDRLYFAGGVLQREVPTTADAAVGDTCLLSSVQPLTQEMFLGATDAGPIVFLASAGVARVAAPTCCDGGSDCQQPVGALNPDLTRNAVHGNELFRVQAAALIHAPLQTLLAGGDLADAAVIRDQLPVVEHLVVDDRFAYFTGDDKIQRLALGDGGS